MSANSKGVVIGVSGGVDSAVVASLAYKAFPNNSLAIMLPCYSHESDVSFGQELIDKIGINHQTINLEKVYDELSKITDTSNKLTLGNMKARLRMTTLYAVAQENNFLVLGTDNAAEWLTGYFTKYGDGGVDLLPLKHLTKREVYQAAKILGIPDNIIARKPTASLFEGQLDEVEMGVTYDEIDDYIDGITIKDNSKRIIETLNSNSQHKKVSIPSPEPYK